MSLIFLSFFFVPYCFSHYYDKSNLCKSIKVRYAEETHVTIDIGLLEIQITFPCSPLAIVVIETKVSINLVQ